jgi:hypothetical protein
MARRRNDPLRPSTDDERRHLTRPRRSRSAPAAESTRAARPPLASPGHGYPAAARAAGRRSGDAVSRLVARVSREGLAAPEPRHGGGRPPVCGEASRARIPRAAARPPTPERDGTAARSLAAPRKALRPAPGGLPAVSTHTPRRVPHGAGRGRRRRRTWCPAGTALRRRKAGVVTVTDPGAPAKNR